MSSTLSCTFLTHGKLSKFYVGSNYGSKYDEVQCKYILAHWKKSMFNIGTFLAHWKKSMFNIGTFLAHWKKSKFNVGTFLAHWKKSKFNVSTFFGTLEKVYGCFPFTLPASRRQTWQRLFSSWRSAFHYF